MLSLEERADLLVKVAELVSKRANKELVTLLSALPRQDLLSEPELGLRLALRWFQFSQYGDARELIEQLTEPCRRGGFDQLYRRRLILEAHLLTEAGELTDALAAYNEVLRSALTAGDQRWVALATSNIGAIAAIRGEWAEALAILQRAMTALQQAGDAHNLAGCHQNLGMVFREMGLQGRADSHFEQATRLYLGSHFDVSLRMVNLSIERALSIYAAGDARRAEKTVRRALEEIGRMEEGATSLRRDKAEALRALGLILLGEGNTAASREALLEALGYAMEERIPLLEAELCEALYQAEHRERNYGASREWMQRAMVIYHKLGANARADRLVSRRHSAALG